MRILGPVLNLRYLSRSTDDDRLIIHSFIHSFLYFTLLYFTLLYFTLHSVGEMVIVYLQHHGDCKRSRVQQITFLECIRVATLLYLD